MEHNEHVDSTHHRDVDKIRILQIGHFIPRKRIDLGVHSLLEPDLKNAELNLVGEPIGGGPNDILELANSLGIGDRVVFHGKLRRNDVIALMTRMDVLLHTSGREGASGVVGEATTVGLPVVCFKGTGSASVLSQSGASGIVLDPKDGVGTTEIAKAVREAASLPRVQAKIWTVGRVERLVASLYEQARARQRPAA
jgi:glycosyltransferase involved in cell wall biosynthesis